MVFICAYYLYEIGMLYAYTGKFAYFLDAMIHLIVNLCLFYFNAHIVLSKVLQKRNKLITTLYVPAFIALEFLIYLLIKYTLTQFYQHFELKATNPYVGWEPFLRDVLWRFIYIFGLSSAYWFAISSAAKQRRLSEMENIRLKELAQQEIIKADLQATENAYLKSQINSHFLFNTLSYLYSSVYELKKEVGETILHLSEILRYSYNSSATGKVRLTEELDHIKNIFNISQVKSSKKMELDFSVNGVASNHHIIPLVLITLAENILKYADFTDPEYPCQFHCTIEETKLRIYLSNKKRQTIPINSNGIGMKNIIKRLNLAYENNYTLKITNSAMNYQLELIIPLENAV